MLKLLLWLMMVVTIVAGDWPQYRGPTGTGASPEQGWNAAPDWKEAWSARIGPGYSVPSVANGRVYVAGAAGEGNNAETIYCFDAATGKELWRVNDGCSPWSSAAAGLLNGQLTIVHLTGWSVIAVEPKSGKKLWVHDHKAPVNDPRCYSIAASPVTVGDMVIAPTHLPQLGTLALRVRNQQPEVAWKGPRSSWYQTPAVWGDMVLLPLGGAAVQACDLQTGTVRWRAGDVGRPPGEVELPTMPELEDASEAGPRRGGREMAVHRLPGGVGGGAFVVVDGRLIVQDGRGDVVVAEINATGHRTVTRQPVMGATRGGWGCQTHPVLSGGRLYCRNQGELVCFDLRSLATPSGSRRD